MRILFLVTDDWYFWSHRLHLARAVREAGFDVTVVTSGGELQRRIEAEGFRFLPVRFARSVRGQPRNLALLARLIHVYRRVRPDVVQHVSFLPVVLGTLAARATGVRAIVNTVTGLGHVFISGRVSHPLRWAMERGYRTALSGRSVRAIFQNPDDLRLLAERKLVRRENAVLVPGSGVDVHRFRPRAERGGRPVVLFCSRMLWSKGVGVLVEASRILRARGVEHELRLAGQPHSDNPDSIPPATLEGWDERGEARWLGYREDTPALLAEAHVVCLPSYYREGVPKALIEGAASGRPLVSTDTPGCREIVVHGENGLLVPERDATALAGALGRLLANPRLRRAMGAAGRKLAEERFSTEVVNSQILEVYRDVLGGRWPAAPARLPERLEVVG